MNEMAEKKYFDKAAKGWVLRYDKHWIFRPDMMRSIGLRVDAVRGGYSSYAGIAPEVVLKMGGKLILI